MGLALSSSHHYSSQLRVRAQSDRHSSGNTVQLTLVNNKKKTKPQNQTKAKEILMTNLKAIITLGILLRVDTFFPVIREMWRCISKRCFSFTRALNTSFLCGQCTLSHRSTHTYRVVLLFADKHNGKTTGSCYFPFLFSSKPFNIKAVFTSVWWHHAEC